jgi:hypothetical protein
MEIAKLVLEYVKALAWPLTIILLSLSFRSEIKRLLARLRKAVLPGGLSVDLQEEVREAPRVSGMVELGIRRRLEAKPNIGFFRPLIIGTSGTGFDAF